MAKKARQVAVPSSTAEEPVPGPTPYVLPRPGARTHVCSRTNKGPPVASRADLDGRRHSAARTPPMWRPVSGPLHDKEIELDEEIIYRRSMIK